MKHLFLAVMLLGLVLPSAGEVNPEAPIQYIPFRSHSMVEADLRVRVSFEEGLYVYHYGLTCRATSPMPFLSLFIGTQAELVARAAPPGWSCYSKGDRTFAFEGEGPWLLRAGVSDIESLLQPGHSIEGIVLKTRWLPGIGLAYLRGDVPPPSGQQVMLPPPPGYSALLHEDSRKVKTVVPLAPPEDTLDAPRRLESMIALKHEAAALGWITHPGIVKSLDVKLEHARTRLLNGQTQPALNLLAAFRNELKAQRGKHVNEYAFALLDPHAQAVIVQLAGPVAESDESPAVPPAVIPGLGLILVFLALGIRRWRPRLGPRAGLHPEPVG